MSKPDRKFVGLYKNLTTGKQIEKTLLASDLLEAAVQFDGITYPNHECISISLVSMKDKKPIKEASNIFHSIMKASVTVKPKAKAKSKETNNTKRGK